jgi:hypothetical protein
MGPGFVLGEAGLAPLFDRAFLKMEGSVNRMCFAGPSSNSLAHSTDTSHGLK